MKKLFLVSAALILLTACSKDEKGNWSKEDGRLNIVTNINPMRVSSDESGNERFTNGDKILITMRDEASNVLYADYVKGESNYYWSDFAFGESVRKVSFAGCYPKPENHVTSFVFDVTSASTKDLLLAPETSYDKGNSFVQLIFRHAMSKLVVNYSVGSGVNEEDLPSVKTELTAKPSCNVDIIASTVVADNKPAVKFEEIGKNVSFMIPPQKVQGMNLKIMFKGKEKIFNLKELFTENNMQDDSLIGGKKMVVNLAVTKDDVLFVSTNILPWEEQGRVNGTVSL